MTRRPLLAAVCTTPVLAFALACGGAGSGGSKGADDLAFEEQPAPAAESAPKATEGLGAELGFPVGDGQVKRTDDEAVEVLHMSAFDPGYCWEDYRAQLETAGWSWKQTEVPPYEGIFEKDGERVLLTCELAGTSVWAKAKRL